MNKDKQLSDLYCDYLMTSFHYTTATGLSNLLDGDISHDKITRFLASKPFLSADLWKAVKKRFAKLKLMMACLFLTIPSKRNLTLKRIR